MKYPYPLQCTTIRHHEMVVPVSDILDALRQAGNNLPSDAAVSFIEQGHGAAALMITWSIVDGREGAS